MPATTARRIGAAALVLAAVASTAACSGGDKASAGSSKAQGGAGSDASLPVFDFQGQLVSSPNGLVAKIPDALKAVAGADFSNVMVESFTFTPHPTSDPTYCAIDVKIGYTPGGLEKARAAVPHENGSPGDLVPAGNAALAQRLTGTIHTGPIAESKTPNLQMSEDGTALRLWQACSTDPFSDHSDDEIAFPMTAQAPRTNGAPGLATPAFAWVFVTTMKNGTTTVRKATVDDYQLDSTGTWLKK